MTHQATRPATMQRRKRARGQLGAKGSMTSAVISKLVVGETYTVMGA